MHILQPMAASAISGAVSCEKRSCPHRGCVFAFHRIVPVCDAHNRSATGGGQGYSADECRRVPAQAKGDFHLRPTCDLLTCITRLLSRSSKYGLNSNTRTCCLSTVSQPNLDLSLRLSLHGRIMELYPNIWRHSSQNSI